MTPEAAQGLMEFLFSTYVAPELHRRALGNEGAVEEVWAAQVILNENPPSIRLNEEVRILARANETEEWADYTALHAGGQFHVAEFSLFPEEAGARHFTAFRTGEGDEWMIFFSAVGDQPIEDGVPTLGALFASSDLNTPPLEKLRARTEQLFSAVTSCLEANYHESAMILLYSGIDAMAWLTRPANIDDVRGQDFIDWINAYFLPDSGFTLTATDLFAARCGLVHSNTAESKLNRKGQASKVFYYHEREGVKQGIVQLLLSEALMPQFVDIDQFIVSLRTAIDRFIEAVSADPALLELVSGRIQTSYFSWCRHLGNPTT